MTHHLLVTRPKVSPTRETPKLYSLFRKDLLTGRYTRVAEQSYYLNTAKMVFQDRIVAGFEQGIYQDIRPITFD